MHAFSLSQTLLTGTYRTGSEYFANLIDVHPNVSATAYRVNVLRFLYRHFERFDDAVSLRSALAAVRERVTGRYGVAMDVDRIAALIEDAAPVTLGTVYDAIMSALYLDAERRCWLEKNQLLWREIPLFLSMMPNGRAILLLRDPRAVLASFKHFTTAPAPGYLGAVFNCLDAMRHARDFAAALPAERFLMVRNEDLSRAPAETVGRVWGFIGVDPKVSIPQSPVWRNAYGQPWTFNSSFQKGVSSLDLEQLAEGWREVLSADEIDLVDRVCGSVMTRFGYAPCNAALAGEARTASLPMEECLSRDPQLSAMVSNWRGTGAGCQAYPSGPSVAG